MVPLESDREEILRKLQPLWSESIVFAFLFGSAAEGRLNPESDVDIGVYLKTVRPSFQERLKVQEQFQRALERDVDVIVLNDADPIIVMQVLEGDLIWNSNPAQLSLFRAHKVSEYIDFKKSRKVIEDNLMRKGWPKWSKKT